MMISAMYSEESVDKITWALDAAIDYDIVQPEEFELLRAFITSLNNLKKEGGVVICKPGNYSRMDDAEFMLDCLKGAGVDNWGGYDDALEDYWGVKGEKGE